MLVGRKRSSGSFGADGRRATGAAAPLPVSACCNSAGSSNKLFQSGVKLVVQRAPVLNCLSVPASLQKKFQRPMTKRRAYNKHADEALKRCSLGPRRRMDGMTKLMARAGRGLSYKLPERAKRDGSDGSDSENSDDEEEEKENEKPFEPLCVWTSPHQGGEAKGLPPRFTTIKQEDECGIEEEVTVLQPAPASAYTKNNVFVPLVLAKWLRPHQREGVAFMYECVMGLRDFKGNGCILADDMGLGKTLQSVTLIYTLIKTGITASPEPTAKRVIVVCPCSLVKNWENEFIKWLGPGTVKALALAEADRKTVEKNIDIFVRTKMFNVLIASYECIRTHVGRLNKSKECCDLLVCDEAHRLKNSENQTSQALASLPVKRRVLLTGTPMQNDLQEFFAMVDFTNPGVLGTQEEFRKRILFPILRGREPDATDKQKQKMMDIQNDMSNTVNDFILRRVNTLNAQHLPPKLVQVVSCNLTPIQKNMYQHLVDSKHLQHTLSGKQENCLGSIQMLMKLCNHPRLIVDGNSSGGGGKGRAAKQKAVKYTEEESYAAPGADDLSKFLPFDEGGGGRGGLNTPVRPEWSGKMFVLYRLMKEMRRPGNGNDKIVIVSNYTQTLDLIGRMCRENSWGFCRLDGSITMKKRQKMVDEFNDPSSSLIAFLLSSKAGGCGLNLIGGNRLVLFDPDWNPAVDKQAAARCWRDGQKKRCFTYRFLATGTVEEKIFQRQLSKEGLQSVVDDKEQVNALSTKDLRNLFKLRHGTPSDTHDKLRCERCKIIADHAELEAVKVLPKQLEECKVLLARITEHEDASKFREPIKPEENGVSTQDYEKLVKQPMDFGTIRKKLHMELGKSGSYKSVTEFAKDVNRIFSNVVKVWDVGQEIADEARRLQSWWEQEWLHLAPKLMMMKSGEGKDAKTPSPSKPDETEMTCAAAQTERGEDFQDQIGMPDEENMRHWSHHYSTDTVDDPVFRAAMRGYDSVSFVFGLEVTWSLIQQRQNEEEEKQAMLELEAMRELEESASEEKKEEAICGDDSSDDDATEEEEPPVSENEDGEEQSTTVNDAAASETAAGDEETWDLDKVYSIEEIDSKSAALCSNEGCHRRACSLWKSSRGEEWNSCLDCQDEEFGEWPEAREPTNSDHTKIIASFCSGTPPEEMDTTDDCEAGAPIKEGGSPSSETTCTVTSQSSVSNSDRSESPSQDIADVVSHSTDHKAPTTSSWTCEACTFDNRKSARKCKICSQKRPKQPRVK